MIENKLSILLLIIIIIVITMQMEAGVTMLGVFHVMVIIKKVIQAMILSSLLATNCYAACDKNG